MLVLAGPLARLAERLFTPNLLLNVDAGSLVKNHVRTLIHARAAVHVFVPQHLIEHCVPILVGEPLQVSNQFVDNTLAFPGAVREDVYSPLPNRDRLRIPN